MAEHKKGTLSPKPYFFVRQAAKPNRTGVVGTDRYDVNAYSGRLLGVITAVSPLHIGSGCLELGDALGIRGGEMPQLAYDMVKTGGQVYIPGASLKGCVRSVVEAITASCVSKTKSSLRQDYLECRARGHDINLCPACRLFGTMGVMSRVCFADAVMEKGKRAFVKLPSLYGPKTTKENAGEPARKFYYHHESVSKGGTPYEVCEKDSAFRMMISFCNLSPTELGLLCQSLGVGREAFNLKIGKGKPVGLGSIKVSITRIECVSPRSYKSWGDQSISTIAGDELASKLQSLTSDLKSIIVREQFENFLNYVRKPVPPPEGMY